MAMRLINDPSFLRPNDSIHIYKTAKQHIAWLALNAPTGNEEMLVDFCEDFVDAYKLFKKFKRNDLRDDIAITVDPMDESEKLIFIFKCDNNGDTYCITNDDVLEFDISIVCVACEEPMRTEEIKAGRNICFNCYCTQQD